jgi:hypothetical protein
MPSVTGVGAPDRRGCCAAYHFRPKTPSSKRRACARCGRSALAAQRHAEARSATSLKPPPRRPRALAHGRRAGAGSAAAWASWPSSRLDGVIRPPSRSNVAWFAARPGPGLVEVPAEGA